MVEREKVLKGLECCIDPLKARCPECPYYPCYDEDTTSEKLLADSLALLKGQETVSGWVSVKDRLPSYAELHCEEVLVLHESGSIFSIGFNECIEGESIFGEWEQGFDPISLGATESYWVPLDGVRYWMPLPEPPKEDDA